MSTKQYLEDGEYLENCIDDDRIEGNLSDFHYEEGRWLVVESEDNEFIALVDEEDVHDTLVYEDQEELEQAVMEGDDTRGRYPATDLDEGAMIYDREDGSTFIESTVSVSLEEIL